MCYITHFEPVSTIVGLDHSECNAVIYVQVKHVLTLQGHFKLDVKVIVVIMLQIRQWFGILKQGGMVKTLKSTNYLVLASLQL